VSTKPDPAPLDVAPFDSERAWQLHPKVSIRPERFGALLYHFGTRRLSFLKSPTLLDVVRGLDAAPSAEAAFRDAGVDSTDLPLFRRSLAALAASDMICERAAS
jgi:mycofactocin biosynthesis protein MftB